MVHIMSGSLYMTNKNYYIIIIIIITKSVKGRARICTHIYYRVTL